MTPKQRRSSAIVSAVLGLLLVAFFGLLGVNHQRDIAARAAATASVVSEEKTFTAVQNRFHATQTAIAPILGVTATAQAVQAATATQGAIDMPYQSVNLACAKDGRWQYDPRVTTCTPTSASLTFASCANNFCGTSSAFRYVGGNSQQIPAKHDMQVTVSNLKGNVNVDIITPLGSFSIDSAGNWSSLIGSGGSYDANVQGYAAHATTFILRNVFNGATDTFYLDGKILVSVKQTTTFQHMNFAEVDLESISTNQQVAHTGSATFSNFSYTPLS